jgi:endonuclease/exonuclease/phosphatase family metal-dependent hydrolase
MHHAMTDQITLLNWNFEQNGKGNPSSWEKAHALLAGLHPNVVLRQEMPGADANGNSIMYETERALNVRGWLGLKSCTAIFADRNNFEPVREWSVGPAGAWMLPPTALSMRYAPAGKGAVPLLLGAFHLNYASSTQRMLEAEWLTTLADKNWALPDGRHIVLPAPLGGDCNSYPERGCSSDIPLPSLIKIRDEPHRAHRSHMGSAGQRVMDTRPDEILHMAGLRDVARRWSTRLSAPTAVARTVDGCPTHGPDARVDRVYASPVLVHAVSSVDIIEVPLSLSDHHIVRVIFSASALADTLRSLYKLAD